jgi:dephospho-CoA kinase
MRNFDIGITGLAGSGKDTAADFICREYGYTRVSFAAPLKTACVSLGWDSNKDARGRKLLQDVGMAFRLYDETTWINALDKSLAVESDIPMEESRRKRYVFPDVRFKNEAEYIKQSRNGMIIRVVRDDLALKEMHEHVSERGQSAISVNYVVLNNSSIENLNKQIKEIVEGHASNLQ